MSPPLALIAAVGQNQVIGVGGELPWRLPADLQRFRRLTLGQTLLMGRRTFESIGRPLPGRRTLVLSASAAPIAGVTVVRSWAEARQEAASAPWLVVAGGAQVYAEALPHAQELWLSLVEASPAGEVSFPPLPSGFGVVDAERCPADERNPYAHTFVCLRRGEGSPLPEPWASALARPRWAP